MKASIVEVTDHALQSWRSRVGPAQVQQVEKAAKRARLVKKDEPLPIPMPKLSETAYAYGDGVLFVMSSPAFGHFVVITIITEYATTRGWFVERQMGMIARETR